MRAYPNGGAAFTYTGTLDIRLQKTFTAGGAEVDITLDVYNLPNMGKEVQRIRRQRPVVSNADGSAAVAQRQSSARESRSNLRQEIVRE